MATFSGPSEGHDSAIVSAGVSAQWTQALIFYVNYDGQLGLENYSLGNDNYHSFSGDSYFSRLFWVLSARFLAFSWVGLLLSLAPRGGISSCLINCRRQLRLWFVALCGSWLGDFRRQIPG